MTVLCAGFATLPCAELASRAEGPEGAGETLMRLRVSGSATAQQVEASGARLIADYGAFRLYELPASVGAQFAASVDVEPLHEDSKILLAAGAIDTSVAGPAAAAQGLDQDPGKRLVLVQFTGPVLPAWFQALAATGVQVLTYIPNNAYLVYAGPQTRADLIGLAGTATFVRWHGPYLPQHKSIVPAALQEAPAQESLYTIQLVLDGEANPATLAFIDARRTGPVKSSYQLQQYWNLVAPLSPEHVTELCQRPDVVFVHPFEPPELADEAQALITAGSLSGNVPVGPGYLDWLDRHGFSQEQFDASGFVVDVTDSGIDNGTPLPNHFGLYVHGIRPGESRIVYSRLEGTHTPGGTLAGCDGHGTVNAHIIGGHSDLSGFPYQDARGFRYGLGVAPFARMGSSVIFEPAFTFPRYPDLFSHAYQAGARISSNSWGDRFKDAYDQLSESYDVLVRDAQPEGAVADQPGNQEMVVVFAAGNTGPRAGSIWSPGLAKNIISVGATESVQALGGLDGCSHPDSYSDNANEIAPFQSRGPTADGRVKPDIVAPGTRITGGVIQQNTYGLLGAADPCFNAQLICGGAAPGRFFPLGQQLYTVSSGTSHSCPAVAGGAALIRQLFLNRGWSPPSPAMTKCLLMNSARYVTQSVPGDTLPSPHQGMGAMDLEEAFARGASVPSILRDQLISDVFTSTGESRAFTGTIASPDRQTRVTLVWTDAPGSPVGAVQRNDLDLTVIAGGSVYRGNVFAGPMSVPGGAADRLNNAESIFLPAGMAGPITITVSAAHINSDGLPGNEQLLDQDFALVASNVVEGGSVFMTIANWTITEEGCLPANGLVDPGEILTMSVSLRNAGSLDAPDVSAKLIATDSVEPLSGSMPYGTLAGGGGTSAQLFRFKAQSLCGTSLPLMFELTGAAGSLGILELMLSSGAQATTYSENFDAVVPPAAPSGWSLSGSAEGADVWRLTDSGADSAPNALVVSSSLTQALSHAVSPPMLLRSESAELTFRHHYAVPNGSGGQLLISIAGGPFVEILGAGGSFMAGPYNGLVSDLLPVGWGWTGDSGGYVTTTVRLPAAAGETAQFQWVFASGGTVPGAWHIDSISVTDRGSCCQPPEVVQVSGPSAPATRVGPVDYTVSFTEAVAGFEPADIEIQATGTATAGAVSILGSGSGPYTVRLSQLGGAGTLKVRIKENACIDLDGNPNIGSALSAPVLVDALPVQCVLTRTDPTPTSASNVRFTFSFSKPVIGFEKQDIQFFSSVVRANLGPLEGGGALYSIDCQNIVGNGVVCLRLPQGVCQDQLGNTNLAVDPLCYNIFQITPATRFNYQLVAALTPSFVGQGPLPATLSQFTAGDTFVLELWARQENLGGSSALTCVYADLGYDPNRLHPTWQSPDARYAEPLFLGVGQNAPGLIDELGGCTLQQPGGQGSALSSDWVRVAVVGMKARGAPCLELDCPAARTQAVLSSATSESSAYAQGVISPSAILYGNLTLGIGSRVRPDLDHDGDVDPDDVALLQQCASGPAVPLTSGCEVADLDADGDVDQVDFAPLQRCYSGADKLAVQGCDS